MRRILSYLALVTLILFSCTSQKKTATKTTEIKGLKSSIVSRADTLIITTSESTPFREKPDVSSHIYKVFRSDVVMTTFEIVGNYYKVIINDTTGYVPIAFVKKHTRDQAMHNSTSTHTQLSYSSSSSSVSTKGCSAVQCSGTTQKGSRCRNRTTNCSGRCYLH